MYMHHSYMYNGPAVQDGKTARSGDYQAAAPGNDCIRSTAAIGHEPLAAGDGRYKVRRTVP
ncbi:hypothetical protein Trco_006187 [Trichoderma cornu-damae]|uniref:Uncharacterized protein n=1 Tax=Trichoderma cornu-damae TaxID=654480 RepID=A0A9P8QGD5_9HYPO|nr:hypothetical protein Trco_006187 [Trichoderma cornu-damae]